MHAGSRLIYYNPFYFILITLKMIYLKFKHLVLTATLSVLCSMMGIPELTAQSCCTQDVHNIQHCNGSLTNSFLWFQHSNGHWLGYKTNASLTFEVCDDGTATMHATDLLSSSGTGDKLDINITFSGYNTSPNSSGHASGGSCATASPQADWFYYYHFGGTFNSDHYGGGNLTIKANAPAFQIGTNAITVQTGDYGGSGWFTTNNNHIKNGDFHMKVDPGACNDIPAPPSPSCGTCSSEFVWDNNFYISNNGKYEGDYRFLCGSLTETPLISLPGSFHNGSMSVSIPNYVSADGYPNRVNVNQPCETWKVQFFKNGTMVGQTGSTDDVPDFQAYAWSTGSLGSVALSNGATHFKIVHTGCTGCTFSSAQSVLPTSICFCTESNSCTTATVCNESSYCPMQVFEWLDDGDVFLGIVQPNECLEISAYDGMKLRIINTNHQWNNLSYDESVMVNGCNPQTFNFTPDYCDPPVGCNNISVSLGPDQLVCDGANATLTATPTSPCTSLSCCERDAWSTGAGMCSTNNDDYVLYLSSGTIGIRRYAAVDVTWTECNDGTARLSGLTRHAASGDEFYLDVVFQGGTTTPPADSPKENNCHEPQSNMYYYTHTEGTITNDNGHVINISRRGPAFQRGMGANVTSTGYGGSGWLHVDDSTGGYTYGDINVMLSQTCDDLGSQVGSYVWSTGETGSSINASSSGQYCVTYTDCHGCEATDCMNINLSSITVDAGADQKICLGEQATLTASAGASYLWSTGNGIQTITVSPTTTTTYSVTVTDAEGCTGVDDVIVEVNNAEFLAVAGNPITGCDATDGSIDINPDMAAGTSLLQEITLLSL